MIVGDSITHGVTHAADGDRSIEFDPAGGFTGRLQARLGDRASIFGRGIAGSTTIMWMDDPRGEHAVAYQGLIRRAIEVRPPGEGGRTAWNEFDFDAGTDQPSLLLRVLADTEPDVVILLLGVNDFVAWPVPREKNVVEVAARRIALLRRQAESVARTVLVATLLPNERDPPRLVEQLNARIRRDHPDFLPLGDAFEERDWKNLLADEVHPSERGYAVLAEILEDALIARGLVAPGDDAPPSTR